MSGKNVWPQNCPWPEPIWDGEGDIWDLDLVEMMDLDEEGQELLEIKEYMDGLVEEGRLNQDYSLNEDDLFDDADNVDDSDDSDDEAGDCADWRPEKGIDYWEDGFDFETWRYALSEHVNLLKIDTCEDDPVSAVRQITHYDFINENLLRQAFTRRAFGLEHGVGDSEQLEFYGDMVLNMAVTREMYKHYTFLMPYSVETPYSSSLNEGDLSKVRSKFVNKDYLAERARLLKLDRFILYGKGEEGSESAREDMMEALIGAVAIDSGWDWNAIETAADGLLCIQFTDDLLKKSYYEMLNTWHQKKFGRMPEYEVFRRHKGNYSCTIRFQVPENDKGIRTGQRIDVDDDTRSSAREFAAKRAFDFIAGHGLWMNLSDAGVEPRLENAINQLQELYQKKYILAPEYQFEEQESGRWYCTCRVDGIEGYGKAAGKIGAKKRAAFVALVRLMKSAGISRDEWEKAVWETLSGR